MALRVVVVVTALPLLLLLPQCHSHTNASTTSETFPTQTEYISHALKEPPQDMTLKTEGRGNRSPAQSIAEKRNWVMTHRSRLRPPKKIVGLPKVSTGITDDDDDDDDDYYYYYYYYYYCYYYYYYDYYCHYYSLLLATATLTPST